MGERAGGLRRSGIELVVGGVGVESPGLRSARHVRLMQSMIQLAAFAREALIVRREEDGDDFVKETQ